VIEIMIRNPNVDSFVKEKEAELAARRREIEALRGALVIARQHVVLNRNALDLGVVDRALDQGPGIRLPSREAGEHSMSINKHLPDD